MLDVIYTDAYGRELGILPWVAGDFTIGVRNNFELKTTPDLGLGQNCFLMIDGSEYGGVVDGIEIDTTQDFIVLTGRTWHGILETSIITPDSGSAHVVVSGECNSVIGQLITRQGLGGFFCASDKVSEFTVNNYQVLSAAGQRYSDMYSGLRRMLKSVGARLNMAYDASKRKVVLSAVPVANYVDDGMDGDRTDFTMKTTRPINHLIALGGGNLANRTVVHVYADKTGKVSQNQTIFGIGHKAEVYDNPNCESASDLLDYATQALVNYQKDLNSCGLTGERESDYQIDDIVGAISTKHNMRIVTTIAQKIASIDSEGMTFTTKTELEV